MASRRKKLFNEGSDVVLENIKAACSLNADLKYLEGLPQVQSQQFIIDMNLTLMPLVIRTGPHHQQD